MRKQKNNLANLASKYKLHLNSKAALLRLVLCHVRTIFSPLRFPSIKIIRNALLSIMILFCIAQADITYANDNDDKKAQEEEEETEKKKKERDEHGGHGLCIIDFVANLARTDLKKGAFVHTCAPQSLIEFFVQWPWETVDAAIGIGLLNIYDPDNEIFPGNKRNCDLDNRADYYDPRISFSMCNDGKLFAAAIKGIHDAIWNNGPYPFVIAKKDYHSVYRGRKPGDTNPFFAPYNFKIKRIQDKICVVGLTGATLGCKYIKEPFPQSKYHEFFDPGSSADKSIRNANDTRVAENLQNTRCSSGSCYSRTVANSKTPSPVTGPVLECLRSMSLKLLTSSDACSFDNNITNAVQNNNRASSPLFLLQTNMRKAVSALLTIYIIFFGIKITLSQGDLKKSDIINFVVKFLFVVYFSVGIDIHNGPGVKFSGIADWAIPFLINGMSALSSWVIDFDKDQLCYLGDLNYDKGFEGLKVWDYIDCKLYHYIGFNKAMPVPPYILLAIPGILLLNLQLVMLACMYFFLVILMVSFAVRLTATCTVTIVLLLVLSPIIVPLYLFDYTKEYFLSWVRLLISCMIQPMIAVLFTVVAFYVIDGVMYTDCKYTHHDQNGIRHFEIDDNWQSGSYSKKEEMSCRASLGYTMSVNNLAAKFRDLPSILDFVIHSGSLVKNILIAAIMFFIMKSLSDQILGFTTDISQGLRLNNLPTLNNNSEEDRSKDLRSSNNNRAQDYSSNSSRAQDQSSRSSRAQDYSSNSSRAQDQSSSSSRAQDQSSRSSRAQDQSSSSSRAQDQSSSSSRAQDQSSSSSRAQDQSSSSSRARDGISNKNRK